jgi:hypothetical protein
VQTSSPSLALGVHLSVSVDSLRWKARKEGGGSKRIGFGADQSKRGDFAVDSRWIPEQLDDYGESHVRVCPLSPSFLPCFPNVIGHR